MIPTPLLITVVVVEAALLAALLVAYLGGGFLADRARGRREARVARGRRQLAAAIERDLSPAALADLAALPFEIQVRCLQEVGGSIIGPERDRLALVASEIGLVGRAERYVRDRRWWRRLFGLRAFGLLPGRIPGLLGLLEDPHPLVRAQAIELAAQPADATDPAVIRKLVERLYDPERLCRFAVHDALLRVGDAAVPALVEALSLRNDVGTAEALEVARWVGDSRFAGRAAALASHARPRVRMHAAMLLGRLGGDAAEASLVRLVRDDDPVVRAAAARSLGQLRVPATAVLLADALNDRAWPVRRAAATALTRLGATGEVMLRDAVRRDDRYASDIARHALDLKALGVEEDAA